MDDNYALSADTDGTDIYENVKAKEADPYDFGAAEPTLNEAAKRVNAVWISFIVLCVYLFIATYTVTPATLFRDAPVKMPIFNAELSLKVYFVMAPALIFGLHVYLIVLTRGLSEKISVYEKALRRKARIKANRDTLRARLDNSINLRAMTAGHREARQSGVDYACALVAGVTMNVAPVLLLLLTLLIFLPYQNERVSWALRVLVPLDVALCAWALWPDAPRLLRTRRALFAAFNLFAVVIVFLAAFPGEELYRVLAATGLRDLTVKMFEGPADPVDYVHRGGVLPFPNRLILPDDPKLAEVAGAPAGGVSLSVRGRNFRKAVFDRSNLARADFSAADLTEASLQGAKLQGAKFECAVPGAFFTPDDTPNTTFWSEASNCAIQSGARIWNAILDGASLREARINGADLENAIVNRADFKRAVLWGARLSSVRGSAANFSEARLTGADLRSSQPSFSGRNRASC